uniref:phosphopantetheine-binding protein n=1 Tax=uncultured Xanthomonas sp. TaxID=152831 RepID=UPI0025F39E4C
ALAQLWQELLERDAPVGADDNFFRLGGHSLLATRMVLAVNQRWPDALQLKDVFEQQSLLHLARHIDGRQERAAGKQADRTAGNVVHEELEW